VPFFLLFYFALDDPFIQLEAVYCPNVTLFSKSKQQIVIVFIFAQCASESSKKWMIQVLINPYKLFLFNFEQFYDSFSLFSWNNDDVVVIHLFEDGINGWGRNPNIVNPFDDWVIFIEAYLQHYVLFTISKQTPKDIESFVIYVFRWVERISFMCISKVTDHFVLG
jgi:hypothetical protein